MNIPKEEVLRYLGYSNDKVDPVTNDLIHTCIKEIQQVSHPQYTHRIFRIHKQNNSITFEGTTLQLHSIDLAKLLKTSSTCAVIAATLGIAVDQKIARYQKTNMSKAVVFNACAVAAIEEVCDQAQAEIQQIASLQNLNITMRYSPGYGDVPIDLQKQILSLLDAGKKIGLTCTDSSILLPTKSVTAFIGLCSDEPVKGINSCQYCNNNQNCNYKKRGRSCGHS